MEREDVQSRKVIVGRGSCCRTFDFLADGVYLQVAVLVYVVEYDCRSVCDGREVGDGIRRVETL